jgi:phage terminase large subunit
MIEPEIQEQYDFSEEDFDRVIRGELPKFTPLIFQDPVEFSCFFDDNLRLGRKTLHKWQVEVLLFIANGDFSAKEALQFILITCNGSGKDAFIITLLSVYLATHHIRHRVIITSSSYTQLKNQTQNYIRSACNTINRIFAEKGVCDKVFLIKKDHIVCNLTGSEIIMFVTDDPGRAEGYHPFPDYVGSEVTIVVNEAKSLEEEIFGALRRCTYSRWLEISSTGKTSGHFFNIAQRAREWNMGYKPGIPFSRIISAYDCPHISEQRIEEGKRELGENSPLFRSLFLAEFVSINEEIVITKEKLDQVLAFPPALNKELKITRRAGVDLAAGGDECALYVVENNSVLGKEVWQSKDTSISIALLIEFFKKWDLLASNIYADDGGVGRAIIDGLRDKGWAVNRVLNQSSAVLKKQFGNSGAERWFNFSRILPHIILPSDDYKLHSQLCSRHYKQSSQLGKIILESKKDAKLKGHGSPDRADALVLAFTDLTEYDFVGDIQKKDIKPFKSTKSSVFTPDFLQNRMERKISMLESFQLKAPRISSGVLLRSFPENSSPRKESSSLINLLNSLS